MVLILRKLHDGSYATSTIRMCYYRYIFHVDSEKSQLRAKGHNQVSHTPMGGQKETVDRKANQTEPKCWFLRFSVGGSFLFLSSSVSRLLLGFYSLWTDGAVLTENSCVQLIICLICPNRPPGHASTARSTRRAVLCLPIGCTHGPGTNQ